MVKEGVEKRFRGPVVERKKAENAASERERVEADSAADKWDCSLLWETAQEGALLAYSGESGGSGADGEETEAEAMAKQWMGEGQRGRPRTLEPWMEPWSHEALRAKGGTEAEKLQGSTGGCEWLAGRQEHAVRL